MKNLARRAQGFFVDLVHIEMLHHCKFNLGFKGPLLS